MICVFVLLLRHKSHSGLVHQYITDVCAGTCLYNFINHVSFNKTVVLVPKLASLTSAKIIEALSASADPIVLRFFTAHHLGVFPECPNVQLSTDLRAVPYPAELCVMAKTRGEEACQTAEHFILRLHSLPNFNGGLTCTQSSVMHHPVPWSPYK